MVIRERLYSFQRMAKTPPCRIPSRRTYSGVPPRLPPHDIRAFSFAFPAADGEKHMPHGSLPEQLFRISGRAFSGKTDVPAPATHTQHCRTFRDTLDMRCRRNSPPTKKWHAPSGRMKSGDDRAASRRAGKAEYRETPPLGRWRRREFPAVRNRCPHSLPGLFLYRHAP